MTFAAPALSPEPAPAPAPAPGRPASPPHLLDCINRAPPWPASAQTWPSPSPFSSSPCTPYCYPILPEPPWLN